MQQSKNIYLNSLFFITYKYHNKWLKLQSRAQSIIIAVSLFEFIFWFLKIAVVLVNNNILLRGDVDEN